MKRDAKFAGWRSPAPTRAHATTGSASAITGDLGNGDGDDEPFGPFGVACPEQTVRDHTSLVEAIDKAVVPARFETE